MKKAAMFGLDARIALAIFGTLSVISGTSLYSAISEGNAVKVGQNIKELIKAMQALHLDLRYIPTVNEYSSNRFDLRYLYSNPDNLRNWNGPYLDNGEYVLSNIESRQYLNKLVVSHIIGVAASLSSHCTSYNATDKTKHYFMIMSYDKNQFNCNFSRDEAEAVHDYLDTDGDYSTGKVQVATASSGGSSIIYNLDLIGPPSQ